jgi:hypothetical protein
VTWVDKADNGSLHRKSWEQYCRKEFFESLDRAHPSVGSYKAEVDQEDDFYQTQYDRSNDWKLAKGEYHVGRSQIVGLV